MPIWRIRCVLFEVLAGTEGVIFSGGGSPLVRFVSPLSITSWIRSDPSLYPPHLESWRKWPCRQIHRLYLPIIPPTSLPRIWLYLLLVCGFRCLVLHVRLLRDWSGEGWVWSIISFLSFWFQSLLAMVKLLRLMARPLPDFSARLPLPIEGAWFRWMLVPACLFFFQQVKAGCQSAHLHQLHPWRRLFLRLHLRRGGCCIAREPRGAVRVRRRPLTASPPRWWQPEFRPVVDRSSPVSGDDVEAMHFPEATPMLKPDACIVHRRWVVYVSSLDFFVIFILVRVAYVPWDCLVPSLYLELNV